jgi:hypothetical protein
MLLHPSGHEVGNSYTQAKSAHGGSLISKCLGKCDVLQESSVELAQKNVLLELGN